MINCSKEYLELVRNATLFDDPYMDVFFKDQPQLAQFVLRLILDKPDLVVESVRIQDTIPDLGSKTVRMDITATDSTGKLYDIEFQTVLGSNLKERGRFYQSKIDNDVLRKGMIIPDCQNCILFSYAGAMCQEMENRWIISAPETRKASRSAMDDI